MHSIKINLWLASFITAIIIPILVFNSLVFNLEYYKEQFKILDIYSIEPEADNISAEILNFFNSNSELITNKLTSAEKSHLADVKQVFSNLKTVMYFLIGLLLFLFFLIIKRLKTKDLLKEFIANYFLIISIILFAVMIVFAISLFNFTSAFQNMHELLFPQGNYAFPEDSMLITLFPEQFFINFVKDFVINIAAISVLLFGLGIAVKRVY